MQPLPEVTKNLLIINILMYIAQLTIPSITNYLALYPIGFSDNFNPFQIVTYMFLHSTTTPMHIIFNMFGLFMFGRDIEYVLGAKKFLFLYLAAGLGAAFFHMGLIHWELSQLALQYPLAQVEAYSNGMLTLGASGSIYGLLAAFGMLYPNRMIMLMFPPIPMKAKYFVLIFGALELYWSFRGSDTSVAHFAHVGGAVVGALLILFWRKQGEHF